MHSPPGEHDLIITPGNNQTIEVRAPLAIVQSSETHFLHTRHADQKSYPP